MSPTRRPQEPKRLVQVFDHDGDHEIILRVSRRTRIFLWACLLALVFSGTGTTFGAVIDTVRLLMESGVVTP